MLGKLRVFTSKKLIALLVSFTMCFVVLINTSEVSHAAEGSVRNVATAKYVLSEVRRVRTLFYDDPNVHYNHMSLKDYLSTHNISREQYVNGIQYDSRLEDVADRRARETVQHGKIGHFGPDGVSKPSYPYSAWAENLAWGSDVADAMNMWTFGEKDALIQSDGECNQEDGHLHNILNPDIHSFAYGEAEGGEYDLVQALSMIYDSGDTDYAYGKLGEKYAPAPVEHSPVYPDIAYIIRNNDVAVGVNAYSNDALDYRWLSYNLNTQQWDTIADWNGGNWASWVTKPGDYWLRAEVRDPLSGKTIGSKTIAFHYELPGQTVVSGTYAAWQGNNVLLGATTNNPNGSTKIKIYDYNAKQWVEGFDGPWALWSPRPGVYWTHFEAYDENGNLSDVKTYAFGV